MRRPTIRVPALAAPMLTLTLTLTAQAGAASRPPQQTPTRLAKLGRVLELEDLRSAGAGELERLLHDSDRGVRRRAALAAGRLGDPSLVPALVERMNDGELEVRRMAAFALGLLGDHRAAERLRAALADPDALVRGRAAEALGRIGDVRSAAAIARLVTASLPATIGRMTVRDEQTSASDDWTEERLALIALARLRDRAALQQALLAEGRPRFDWWLATWAATRVAGPAVQPVFAAAAASDDPRSRAMAARGLGELRDPAALATLVALTRDADAQVVIEALRALAVQPDRKATSAVAALLDSANDLVRGEALRALALLPPDPSLRGRILSALTAREAWVRAAAFPALARTSPEDFTLVLSGLDPDPAVEVRMALAAALGSLADEVSIGVLHSMLQDGDPRVLAAVLEALRRARGQDALHTLRRHLEHAEPAVRAAAAQQIGLAGAKGAHDALLAAWERGQRENPGEVPARLAVVDALAAAGGEARGALTRIAEQDRARAVRARAVQALRAQGAPAADPGVEERPRPPADYRELMAPYHPREGVTLYTPRVFLHTRKGSVEIQLDVIEAPLAAASFLSLARRGFYDGQAIDGLEPGVRLTAGSASGAGGAGPGYALRDEVTRRPLARGVVGLMRPAADAGGSRFFVALAAQPQLEGEQTVFGWVAAGMDVVDRLRPGDVVERVSVWGED